ncbi:uncharacterized protein LOC124656599 [Lolium rigidum]|uniref:uncharacterized protein LOC124656599 n=1 Tax=Lolium rigidum TaxID=89674 RepID=UPI001F5D2AAD|nr:uncharacterized protein LOC124656599 [Lolium rigidum]
MVKQKIVLKLPLDGERNRRKAFKATVGMAGVTSATMEGDKIIIVGDGIDTIGLTTMLRRSLGRAELVSVSSGDDKRKEVYGYGGEKNGYGYGGEQNSYGGAGNGGGKDSKGGGGYHQNAVVPMQYPAYHQYNAMPSYPAYSYPAHVYQQQELGQIRKKKTQGSS